MKEILEAIQSQDATSQDFAALKLPESYRGVTVHKDETEMFAGLETREKDPRKSLHLDDVPLPELGPGEALVAVMASSVNYNSVWTSIFEPLSTFGFLERYGRVSELTKRHDLPYHVIGSDLAGVVLRTGPGVNAWNPGDEVVAHCLSVELESSDGHNDTMLDPEQRIWGFETNFGGLAEIALVKSNQLMPKPDHLSWEEAAAPGLVNSTAYRQLVSRNGAGMKQGDNVLIWGASGGLGSYATQFALAGGATPVCVVSSPEKAEICRNMGAEAVISGYMHEYDNRYLWMSLKRIIGSHFANYREAWEANRLIAKGRIHPTLSKVYSLEETGQAAYDVHRNLHQGKVGVLALAPEEGLGVRNHEMRAQHLDAINRFRNI
ncbi:crotonyl-CoA carboxylase/reductase [Streptomyces albidoflavus]|uniref:crotonyl-CoA carboxylase/reductase n=1 Tax=Streptomyces albidoflavus TaxID=1886 RepID=UPI000FEDA282|nr:crotonyl-CoA carboxylase/reductase [Streptomyces albidoflavus]RWZ76199.1 crotonyl-CoA carboxylase/reductase [Streptomyces albidoflavus]